LASGARTRYRKVASLSGFPCDAQARSEIDADLSSTDPETYETDPDAKAEALDEPKPEYDTKANAFDESDETEASIAPETRDTSDFDQSK